MKRQFVKLNKNATLPERATETDWILPDLEKALAEIGGNDD